MNKNLAILTADCGKLPKLTLNFGDNMQEFAAAKLIESWNNIRQWRDKIDKLPVHSVVSNKVLAELYLEIRSIKIPDGWTNAESRHFALEKASNADYWTNVAMRCLKHLHGKFPDAKVYRLFPGDLYNVQDILDVAEKERKKPIIAETISTALFELEAAIHDELLSRKFVMLEPESSKLFNSKAAWLTRIAKKLPAAKKDLVIAGNCLAMDFHTAAVFHSMRAAEIGMRELCRGIQSQPTRAQKNILIEDADWGELNRAIKFRIESESQLPKASRTIIKSGFKDFRLLTQHIDILKDTRNNVMHAQDFYNKSEARGVFERVKHFLQKLVEKI